MRGSSGRSKSIEKGGLQLRLLHRFINKGVVSSQFSVRVEMQKFTVYNIDATVTTKRASPNLSNLIRSINPMLDPGNGEETSIQLKYPYS